MAPPVKKYLALIAGFAALFTFIYGRIPMSDRPGYYDFADRRELFGVTNASDVMSNIAFATVGVWGLWLLWKTHRTNLFRGLTSFQAGLGIAIILTSLGSAYFHLQPSPTTIYWDRLPMILAFACILGWVVADKVATKFGWWTFLVAFGVGSLNLTLWWQGFASLRPYFILQYGGFLLIVSLAALLKNGQIPGRRIALAMGIYAFAKVIEFNDAVIFSFGEVVGGHALKHLAAACTIQILMLPLPERMDT